MTFHIARSIALVFALSGLSWCSSAYALGPKVPIPDEIPGVTKVNAEGVVNLSEKTSNLIIIDSRVSGDRNQGYIEKSISLPDEKTNCASLGKVIPKKSSPTLFYCNGVKCGRSVVAVRIALKCGYKNLYWFRGGYEEWIQKNYPFVQE
jgi:rhodanese-related sulfurtransferase